MKELSAPPGRLGFRMPAEWAPHSATWLAWPFHADIWPGDFEPIETTFAQLAAELSRAESTRILVPNPDIQARAERLILAISGIKQRLEFFHIETDDSWIRDFGPTFVTRNTASGVELAMVGWIHNAWGGKYPPWDKDAAVAKILAERLGIPIFQPGIVMEGGAIEVNGEGMLLTTEQCLLNPNRNPTLTKVDIESTLRDCLGVSAVIWLGDGLSEDHTDGHIDTITRFASANTLVTTIEPDPQDPNHAPLAENLERLRRGAEAGGVSVRIETLPAPEPFYFGGQRWAASYANFVFATGRLLVPIYNSGRDSEALATLARIFPDRQIVPIDCRYLIRGGGALHCVTQQQPAVGPGI